MMSNTEAARIAKRKKIASQTAPLADSTDHRKLRVALMRWYERHARDLPWRHTRDPYAIWVSEVMLQQTQVKTVIPYYQRFLQRFPTPAVLAEASEDEVMSLWSGLGYYRRARLLHEGAREVVAHHGGQVPREPERRIGLPGIGAYTSGAIGSIAFDQKEPIVDGNVTRVLSRVFGIETPVGRADTERLLWEKASQLVQGRNPGIFNQAMMELGATVCTKRPRCEQCPLQSLCYAFRAKRVAELPKPRLRPKALAVQWAAVAVPGSTDEQPSGVWLARGTTNLFGGLWALPTAEGKGKAVARTALTQVGINARLKREPIASLTHILSHRRLDLTVWRSSFPAEVSGECRLFQWHELAQIGTSTLTRKLLLAAFPEAATVPWSRTQPVSKAHVLVPKPEFDSRS